MNLISNFLNPVNAHLEDFIESLPMDTIGKTCTLNTGRFAIDINPNAIALIGIPEDRNAINNKGTGYQLDELRKQVYKLYVGNWHTKLYDLGDVIVGATYKDTEIALTEITADLVKNKILPIFIGGSHALTHAIYRGYDVLEQKVNLTVVDSKFDLGNIADTIDSQSYLTKIVMEKPNNLFSYTNIGYQTFLNSQKEISLLDSLLFDAYRLGDVKNNIDLAEPTLRESDILSIDISAIRQTNAPANNNTSISGFNADEICKITRYAGLSDKLNVLGIFEYNPTLEKNSITAELIAQMLWYYIEGVNYRSYEFPTADLTDFTKYMVLIDDEIFQFYKSDRSNRWWMEISIKENNKQKKHTLVACTYNDYIEATQQEIPKRWYMNRKKRN